MWTIGCDTYTCIANHNHVNGVFINRESAISAWNRRSPGWISIEDERKPIFDECVFVCFKNEDDKYEVGCGALDESGWYDVEHFVWYDDLACKVLYWMPRPKPPKGDAT